MCHAFYELPKQDNWKRQNYRNSNASVVAVIDKGGEHTIHKKLLGQCNSTA